MPEIKNGLLIDSLITAKTIANIEHQVMKLSNIKAIVLHQTETRSAEDTMKVWQTRTYGAHFLVDRGGDKIHTGIDGKLYQTARLDRRCWHVGHILSKCLIDNKCVVPEGKKISAEAQANAIKSSKQRASAIDKIEMPKAYGERFPINSDSVGIEIVTKFDYEKNVYPMPSPTQILAVSYLLEQLIEVIPSLVLDEDIYTHGGIGRKEPSEGTRTITIKTDIKNNATTYLNQMMPKKK